MKQQDIFKGQRYMSDKAKDISCIDSRSISNQYKQRSFGIVTGGKRKAVFPKVLNLGWLSKGNING